MESTQTETDRLGLEAAQTAVVRQDIQNSSNIRSYGYDATRKVLAVEFLSGQIRHFAGVPPELWEAFTKAPSKGAFFHRAVRGKFASGLVAPTVDLGECPNCGDIGPQGQTCRDCGCGGYNMPPK